MDVFQLIKGKLGKDVLSFAWSLSFVLANLALFVFFSQTVAINPLIFPVVAITAFVIIGEIPRWKSCFALIVILSLVVVGSWYGAVLLTLVLLVLYLISAFRYFKKTRESNGINGITEGIAILKHKYNILKFIVATIRNLFFNISYMLFLLLFVWLAALASAYWLGYAVLLVSLADFSALLTVLGVIFGLLQYYFNRHEEKVQQKLVNYFTSVVFPVDKFSFKDFEQFLSLKEFKYREVNKEAEKLIDTNFGDLAKFYRQTGREQSILNMTLSDFGDSQQFRLLEFKLQRTDKLKMAYKDFFKAKRSEIKKDLNKKSVKLNELVWFLFSNVNIVEESNVAFLSLDSGKKGTKAESYTDFLRLAQIDLLKYAFNVVLGANKTRLDKKR